MTAMTLCLDRPGFLPRLSSQHLSRNRLTAPLLASPARVKLLCAPAGSGKSALLAECLLQAPPHCQVCWLPLAGAAQSPADFCAALARALGLESRLESMDEPSLLAYLTRLQTPTWLFLDDYCRGPAPALDLLLDRLLAVSSPALTWWLSGRRRPQCNWPRLLLDDELYECDGRGLPFDQGEIQQLMLRLPQSHCVRTPERILLCSGGWCAGVRIALLDGGDWTVNEGKQGCSGTLLDYLEHELFSTLAPELSEAWRVLAH
jgi:LuxR family maltose regulon positive regulatory protein